MKNFSALFCGILFGCGLALSGMTDTAKVIGFLDILGNWKPDLLFVMGGAVLTTLVTFRFILNKKRPLFDEVFSVPQKTKIDKELLSGACIFGIGWGVYGYCPGPAIASIAYFEIPTLVFLASMTLGMAVVHYVKAKQFT